MTNAYYACHECKSCIYVGRMPSEGFWLHTDSEGMIAFARDWMPHHIGHTVQLLRETDISGMEVFSPSPNTDRQEPAEHG